MTAVDIEYCVPCGMLERATDLQTALLEEYGEGLDRVSLVTGDSGVFEIRADGEVVLDTEEEGYDQADVVARVGEYL